MPGVGGISRRGMPSSLATGVPCIGPGAAEGHQREIARVVAALDRDHANAAHDVGVGDAQDAGGGRDHVEAERVWRMRLATRAARGRGVERHLAAEARLAAEPAEHDIGVGDGRPRAAAAVARRARHGLGAHRADAQRAALVDPGDRAAAGADGVDVDDRQAHRDVSELGFARDLRAGRCGSG